MAAVLEGGFYANQSGGRLFLWAVAASLALHLAVLLILPMLSDAQRARLIPPPLTARLVEAKPPEPAPPEIEPPPQPAARPRPVPAVKAAPQPAPVPAPAERLLSVEPAAQAAKPAFAVPAAPAPVAPAAALAKAEAAPAAPPGSAAGGPDPGSVARFRLELMDLARRYKRYPRIAQDNGWEGRVEVRIAIGADGAIASLAVNKGSGRTVLDEEAQSMIRTAKAKAAIPPGLRGQAFTLEIPVDFFLKDDAR